MSTTMTSVAGALKQVYDDYLQKTQNLETTTLDLFEKSAKKYNPAGQGFYGAINDYGNESGGAQSESESFRTIDSENYAQWKVSPKINIWPVEFTGLVAKAAESDEESFANAVLDAIDTARSRLKSDENRQFFGMGTGLLASPTGTVASTATSFTVDSAQYLRKNMVLDIFNGTTKVTDSVRLSRVDYANSIVYLATSVGVALTATTEIVKENIRDSAASDGKEMMGLRGIVDDGTDVATFQNISVASNDEWQSVRIDASSASLTSDLLQRLEDDVAIGSGEESDMYITHRKQRRSYLDIVVPEKRYADGKMDAGFTKLSFNGKSFVLDKDCQSDTIYALKKSLIKKFELSPLEMGSHDGSDTFLRIANADKFQAYWRHYCNIGTSHRKALGKIVGLSTKNGRE